MQIVDRLNNTSLSVTEDWAMSASDWTNESSKHWWKTWLSQATAKDSAQEVCLVLYLMDEKERKKTIMEKKVSDEHLCIYHRQYSRCFWKADAHS